MRDLNTVVCYDKHTVKWSPDWNLLKVQLWTLLPFRCYHVLLLWSLLWCFMQKYLVHTHLATGFWKPQPGRRTTPALCRVVKPALSQMYDQLLPTSKSLEIACKHHCTHRSPPRHVSVPRSQTVQVRDADSGRPQTAQGGVVFLHQTRIDDIMCPEKT